MGYVWRPETQFSGIDRAEGIVAGKHLAPPYGTRPTVASVRGSNVYAHGHLAPVRMNVADGGQVLECRSLGLQVPRPAPTVVVTPGGAIDPDGALVQLAIRKARVDGDVVLQVSDISPIWPPPTADFTLNTSANLQWQPLRATTGNVRVAMPFVVPTTIAGETAPGEFSSYKALRIPMIRVGTIAAGTVVRAYIAVDATPTGTSPTTPGAQYSGLSRSVLASSVGTSAPGSTADWIVFTFDAPVSVANGQVYWVVIEADYTINGSAYLQWRGTTNDINAGAGQGKVWNSATSTWANCAASINDLLMIVDGAGNPRAHGTFANVSGKSIAVTNIADFFDDAVFEDYNAVQLVIASPLTGGEWKVASTAREGDTQVSFSQSFESLLSAPSAIPGRGRPLGGCRQLMVTRDGGVDRLVAMGQVGWDNWVHPDPVIGRGLLTLDFNGSDDAWLFSSVSSGDDPLAGTAGAYADYLLTVWWQPDGVIGTVDDKQVLISRGAELFRGVIETYQDGDGNWRIRCPRVSARMSEYREFFGTESSNRLRAEVRRRVYATVKPESDEVSLTYADDGSPANIAREWMIGHSIRVGSLNGQFQADVLRVEPLNTPRPKYYPHERYFPSATLVLEAPWGGEAGTGQFGVDGKSDSVRYFAGAATEWEGTGFRFTLQLGMPEPIAALAYVQGTLVAVCQNRFTVTLNGSPFEPDTFRADVTWTVANDVARVSQVFDPLKATDWPGVATDQLGNIFVVSGRMGIQRIDGRECRMITEGLESERFGALDPSTIAMAQAVTDAGFPYFPGVWFVGMTTRNAFRSTTDLKNVMYLPPFSGGEVLTWRKDRPDRSNHFVWLYEREAWLNMSGPEIETACSVTTIEGRHQMLFGSDGRLFLMYPAQRSGQDEIIDASAWGRVDRQPLLDTSFSGALVRSVASGDAMNLILLTTGHPWLATLDGMWSVDPGLEIAKVADDGTYERARILFPTELPGDAPFNTELSILLQPITAWTRDPDASYAMYVGAREYVVAYPALMPEAGMQEVRTDGVKVLMQDNGGDDPFPWPLHVQVFEGNGGQSFASLKTIVLGRERAQQNWWWSRVMGRFTRKTLCRVTGVLSPDSPMFLVAFDMKGSSRGGGRTAMFDVQLKRTIGEATDVVATAGSTLGLRELVNFIPSSEPYGAGVNQFRSPPGADMLNNIPLTRAPLNGANGNAGSPPYEDMDAVGYDQDTMSDPGSMTVLVMSLKDIEGNVVVFVHNGDSLNPWSWSSGRQGEMLNLWQEKWGGQRLYGGAPNLLGYGSDS